MSTIIIPTDFSPIAKNAVQFALPIARQFDVPVILMNTCYIPSASGDLTLISMESYLEDSRKQLEDYKAELIQDSANLGITFETAPRSGPMVEEINRLIDERDAELVVMGTQGATGLEGLLLGSNSARVMKEAHCPVLVIPDEATFDGKLDDIVFATDFSDLDDEEFVLHELVDFARPFDAHIHVLHIHGEGNPYPLEKVDELANRFPDQFKYPEISFRIKQTEDVEAGIQEYAQEQKTDMLAVLTRRRGFFDGLFHRSMAKRMVLGGKVPVLAFHG